MRITLLHKPMRRQHAAVELYQSECITVDSTTTVMEACAGCHNLSTTHQDKVTASIGVGGSVPGMNFSAVVNSNGTVSSDFQIGAGVVVGATATSGGGPEIHVAAGGTTLNAGQRSVTTPSSSTRQDNTRTGNYAVRFTPKSFTHPHLSPETLRLSGTSHA